MAKTTKSKGDMAIETLQSIINVVKKTNHAAQQNNRNLRSLQSNAFATIEWILVDWIIANKGDQK